MMNSYTLNAEFLKDLSVIASDESYMKRAFAYIRKLAQKKISEDETLMTEEEFNAKIERSLEQARAGKVHRLEPGESLDDLILRAHV